MPKSQSIQRILAQAKKKEKRHDWLGAVEFHKKALGQVLKQKDLLKAGGVQERIGYCFHRGAMQAKSQQEFRARCAEAIENYEKSKEFYGKLREPEETPRVLRCDAMIAYVNYWLSSEVAEQKGLINESWKLTNESLKVFEENGNTLEYGRTYNQLSSCALLAFFLEWDSQARKERIKEALEHGEQAIDFYSALENHYELTRAYVKTATYLEVLGYYFLEQNEKMRCYQKAGGYWIKACELSEETAMIEYLSALGFFIDWAEGTDETLTKLTKALKYGAKTKDKLVVGCALDLLAYHTGWRTFATEDPDKRIKLLKRALQYAKDAKKHYSIISFTGPARGCFWAGAPYADYYQYSGIFEANLSKKRELLEKAVEAAPDLLKRAEDSGNIEALFIANDNISSVLFALAMMETNSEEKKRLLEEALVHRSECIRLLEQGLPFDYWDLGINHSLLSSIEYGLVDSTEDPDSKKTILQEAVIRKETALKLMVKSLESYKKEAPVSQFMILGWQQYGYGKQLNLLYEFTKSRECLRKAIEAFKDAVKTFQKANLASRTAECHWGTARVYDILGEHLKAAENFDLASNIYKSAAEKIPQLKDFYVDHASYMQAWSEIELAKHHHKRKRYDKAKLNYEKSANLHKSTEHWNYLGSNYDAWARLEEAEDLSRKEQTKEATDLFQKAADLFAEAKKSIEAKLEKIEVRDEKEMADELAKASEIRHKYCLGRIALEEAKILDRQGDHTASSKKYESAAEIFQEIAKVEPEQSRKELQPIIYLCQAWQKMMIAEAKTSSKSYGEAAELFKQAKEHTLDQPTSLLALANSSFCKALEAGTEFEITGDKANYSATKNHMQAAEKYYLKAGFKTASEYAKATLMLFDAYMYITKAETETAPAKKAQYYRMAEKLLQASEGSYTKAKHPEKSEEVQRLLENIKEKRQLAVSLTEVLHAPTITATTSSFSTPTPTHEKAVGLERFEHADIQANLTASEEVTVEEQMEIKLDLVNVAKEYGLLIRVDDLIPPSFKVTAAPSQYNVEDGLIDMKGRRLDPLKVESVKLSLQATKAGVIDLRPRIIYVDEVGNFKKCVPEPATITVHPKLTVEFKTEAAQRVFDYLVGSFVEDYMRRRLTVQEAGWRSFVQIMKNANVSSRSVYGSRGHRGPAISELERRGLIETRIFLRERGRGGKIVKTRISYEKETVKRLVDQKVVKNE